jgi:hypothetical protein
MTNPYFSSRPPSCPNNPYVIDALLLKLVVRQAIREHLAVSYRRQVSVQLVTNKEGGYIAVYIPAEPELTSSYPPEDYSRATDNFIDRFINTMSVDLEDVEIHSSNSDSSPSVRWGFLKKSCTLDVLFDEHRAPLATKIEQLLDSEREKTNRTTPGRSKP